MSNLRSQYLPITFQLYNGSCKIQYRSLILLLLIHPCMLIIPMPPFSTPILKNRIFCNSSITFKNKPLVFTSFLQNNLRTINDIWDSNNKKFKSCHDLYNLLIDRNGNIFKFRVDKLEYLHTNYFSLSLMSNLRSQYLPITFQLYNGSCKIQYRSLIL
jgi:hypothetical protein